MSYTKNAKIPKKKKREKGKSGCKKNLLNDFSQTPFVVTMMLA